MTNEELLQIYNHTAENSKMSDFDSLKDKLHIRADIHSFLLIDLILQRIPDSNKNCNIINQSGKDIIKFGILPSEISSYITKEEVISLTLSGVSFSNDDGIYRFI